MVNRMLGGRKRTRLFFFGGVVLGSVVAHFATLAFMGWLA